MLILKPVWIISFISGILMGFAAAPWSLWVLAWVALVPLWLTVTQPQQKQSVVIVSGIAWGLGYYGFALFWITGIHPMTWMGVPWFASIITAIFCWIFITAWGIGIVLTWAFLFYHISQFLQHKKIDQKRLNLTQLFISVALWCGLEWLWSLTPLWWASVAYTQSFSNLIILQLGQISGPNTVTAALIFLNGLVAIGWRKRQSFISNYSIALIVFTGLHLLGAYFYFQPLNDEAKNGVKVGMIQGNIPNEIKLNSTGWRKAIEGYTSGYKTLASQGVDLVVTPETALPFRWTERTKQTSSFYAAILKQKVFVLLGGFGIEGNRLSNSLFAINGQGETISQYDKVNLVPLGEYIPFESILGQWIDRLSPLDAHLIHGEPSQQLITPFGQMIVGICYDSAFQQHFQKQAKAGGEFIVTASNDAHYASAMLAQHHAQDVMRAIETNRWTVRATNTGYSGIVNPKGQTLWISERDVYALHADTIYRRQTQTLYVRWGDWLTPFLLIMSGGVILYHFIAV